MGASGQSRIWNSVEVLDADDQKQPIDIYLVRSNVSIGTENAAMSVSDANNIELFGPVKFVAGDYTDVGGAARASLGNIGLVVSSATNSRDLYVAAVTQGTPTHYGTQSMIAPEYVGLLQIGDPALVFGALSVLADERGREPPTLEDCEAFTAAVIVRPGEDLMAVAAELGLTGA